MEGFPDGRRAFVLEERENEQPRTATNCSVDRQQRQFESRNPNTPRPRVGHPLDYPDHRLESRSVRPRTVRQPTVCGPAFCSACFLRYRRRRSLECFGRRCRFVGCHTHRSAGAIRTTRRARIAFLAIGRTQLTCQKKQFPQGGSSSGSAVATQLLPSRQDGVQRKRGPGEHCVIVPLASVGRVCLRDG